MAGKYQRLYDHILMRRSDANVPFDRLCALLIVIFWSSEDNAFVAEVPELPGCMADGRTYREALSNAERIIQEWIETANEVGRPIPQPKGRLAYA